MGYNTKELKKSPDPKKPSTPKDIIYDLMGQWNHPGQNTRIPSNSITMSNVPYPVWAQPNVGEGVLMQPEQDYYFDGANYVDEIPVGQTGGWLDDFKKGGVNPLMRSRSKRNSTYKNIQSSINKLMMRNVDLFGPAGKNIYDPNSKFEHGGWLDNYQEGGEKKSYADYIKQQSEIAAQKPVEVIQKSNNVSENTETVNRPQPQTHNINNDIPQTGIVVDKRTNLAYYIGNNNTSGSFNVLTGKNPDRNIADHPMADLEVNPMLRATPKGSYLLQKQDDRYDHTKNYKNNRLRNLKPIEAYSQNKPIAENIAFHMAYSDNTNNPTDPEYLKRIAKLKCNDPTKRWGSYGCVNASMEDYDKMSSAFPKSDTLVVMDSNNKYDQDRIAQFKKNMQKTKLKTNIKKNGGWLDNY